MHAFIVAYLYFESPGCYQGQTVNLVAVDSSFEVGNYLGGGSSGTVYEAEYSKTKENYALKILNPLGYKLLSPTVLRRCQVIVKGEPYEDTRSNHQSPKKEHVWWLLNASTKQYLVAYYSERDKCLKELTLKQCVKLWGTGQVSSFESGNYSSGSSYSASSTIIHTSLETEKRQVKTNIPTMPPKFVDFVHRRSRIFREIINMRKISHHRNVIKIQGVLEFFQESKCTIFLVMELANGGELFDRIKLDCGTREETARGFFQQLLDGVRHCHDQGVCHRDLKPENLLLSDSQDFGTMLKIADFGFSARFANATTDVDTSSSPQLVHDAILLSSSQGNSTPESSSSTLRTLTSVVGSPFYVAPEILHAKGYSGPKADMWSIGVILYAILAGNLPFSQELISCKRFKKFCKWVDGISVKILVVPQLCSIDYPEWLFPSKFSNEAKALITGMLHPDPQYRISVEEALKHPWCINENQILESDVASAQVSGLFESTDMGKSTNTPPEYNTENSTFSEAELCSKLESMEYNGSRIQEKTRCSVDIRYEPTSSKAQSGTGSCLTISQPVSTPPPIAPASLAIAQVDILESSRIVDVDIDTEEHDGAMEMFASLSSSSSFGSVSRQSSTSSTGSCPPSFSDHVKRSTRFITSVSASDVLQKIVLVLEKFRDCHLCTSIGVIERVELISEAYRIDVWSNERQGSPIMEIQLYQLPIAENASVLGNAAIVRRESMNESFLVEFIRGHTEIFAFKVGVELPAHCLLLISIRNLIFMCSYHLISVRFLNKSLTITLLSVHFFRFLSLSFLQRFYQEVRLQVEELVKRDFSSSFLTEAPPTSMLSRFS